MYPSVQQLDQTGSKPTGRAAEDYLTNWTRGRPDQDVVLDHVLGKLWPSVVVDALTLQHFFLQKKEEIRYRVLTECSLVETTSCRSV